MKIISVHCRQDSIQQPSGVTLTAVMTRTGIEIGIDGILRSAAMHVRFEGASLIFADTNRNAGKAAAGAVAGALLFGPLGALAGGALGGGTSHTLVLNSPDARIVLEADKGEFQRFLGLGLPTDTQVAIQAERLPTMDLKGWVKPTGVIAAIIMLFLVFRPRSVETPTAKAASYDQLVAVENTQVLKPAAPKVAAKAVTAKAKAKAPPTVQGTSKARDWVTNGHMKVSETAAR